jgi:hypothetical protein
VPCDLVDSRTTPFPEYKIKTPVTIALGCTDTCRRVTLRDGESVVFFNNVFNKGNVMGIYPGRLDSELELELG